MRIVKYSCLPVPTPPMVCSRLHKDDGKRNDGIKDIELNAEVKGGV